jgi:hypothetical protein
LPIGVVRRWPILAALVSKRSTKPQTPEIVVGHAETDQWLAGLVERFENIAPKGPIADQPAGAKRAVAEIVTYTGVINIDSAT